MISSDEAASWSRRKLLAFVPFVLAVLVWAGWMLPQRPYAGLESLAADGTIEALDSAGPSNSLLQTGDVIVSVNGTPFAELRRLDGGLGVGDPVRFVVTRDGEDVEASIILARTPRSHLFGGIAPLLLAAAFAIAGTVAYLLVPASRSARLFFLVCQVSAGSLGFALLGMTRQPWADRLFYILFWFTTPLLVHLHLSFLTAGDRPAWSRLLKSLYAIAALGSLPFAIWSLDDLHSMPWYQALYSGARFFVTAGVFFAVGLLVAASRGSHSKSRQQARSILLGGGAVLALFICLTTLPDALGVSPILPYHLAFLLLLVLPVSYTIAVVRRPEAGPGGEAAPTTT